MSTPRKHLLLLLALATTSLAAPGTALAGSSSATPGVHVDPSSPIAKEYALPIATARGAPADTGSNGALFGSGIKKQGTPTKHVSTPTTPSTPTDSQGASGSESPQPAIDTPSVQSTTTATAEQHPDSHRRRPKHRHRAKFHRHPSKPGTHSSSSPIGSVRNGHSGRGSPASRTPAALQVIHPSSGTGWLWMVLVALTVLAIGGGFAVALLHGRRRAARPRTN